MDNEVLEALAARITHGKVVGSVMRCNSKYFNGLSSGVVSTAAQKLYNSGIINLTSYLVVVLYAYNSSAADTASFLRKYGVAAGASVNSVRVTRCRFRKKLDDLGVDLQIVDLLRGG